jgi:hypothetical protein
MLSLEHTSKGGGDGGGGIGGGGRGGGEYFTHLTRDQGLATRLPFGLTLHTFLRDTLRGVTVNMSVT